MWRMDDLDEVMKNDNVACASRKVDRVAFYASLSRPKWVVAVAKSKQLDTGDVDESHLAEDRRMMNKTASDDEWEMNAHGERRQ